MSSSALATTIILALIVSLLVLPTTLSTLWYHFLPDKALSTTVSVKASRCADSRFPAELRTMAAILANHLRDQFRVDFAQLAAQTRFLEDLAMDQYERME